MGTDFNALFSALTGHTPMCWQVRLFERLAAGDIPDVCDLPTGLGKTSIIPIWLLALASTDCAPSGTHLPRRLIYIVNRRTVIDQATAVVEKMRARLGSPEDERWSEQAPALLAVNEALRALAAVVTDEPFGVSTLRGQLADNEEWKSDPARPAIIIGTIDMVGSKLLFSGYGDGRYRRAHHTGLIGQDALIVHDEAHLVRHCTATPQCQETSVPAPDGKGVIARRDGGPKYGTRGLTGAGRDLHQIPGAGP